MPKRTGAAHVVTTTRKYGGKVYRTHLLRRSYREGGRVRNETLGNLSHLPEPLVEIIRRSLQGEDFVPAAERFEITGSLAHGHVEAVRAAMTRLGFAGLVASKSSRERDLVCAMVAARILSPQTKLATTRWWKTTTLADEFGVADADEDALYAAMDWLFERQERIQKKLAARHLVEGGRVLYDLTSSYFEGVTCPLAKRGYSRDGRKGTLQVNYGLLTDARGCPVAVSVHAGNTADADTLMPEVSRLRGQFGIGELVLVGDRGMISQKAIDEIRDLEGMGWITALKTTAIRALVESGSLQLGLFDERDLFEFYHADFPGERLVACRNPQLAKLRAYKREDLLVATEALLEKIRTRVSEARLRGRDAIGMAVGKQVNRYKVAKHFQLDIRDDAFAFSRDRASIAREAALDGIYVIRSSVPAMDSADCVRHYKALANVERAFRSMKTLDLKVRPIHHRLEERVRAHIFLCMLAYYVEWHLREAWRELMFADEDQAAKAGRDPVAPARRSKAALEKIGQRVLGDGTPVHSFSTLLAELATRVRNTCRTRAGETGPTFQITTTPSLLQKRALDCVERITV